MWQSVNQLRSCSHGRAAQMFSVHILRASKSSLPQLHKCSRWLHPANIGGDKQHTVPDYSANRHPVHAGNGRAFTVLTGGAGGLTMI